jgi:methylated-DNA-[protein]-cysteine S-methyltransferase
MSRMHTVIDSPIGELTLVALVGLYIEQHQRRPDATTFGPSTEAGCEDAVQQLGEYFAGGRTTFDLDVRPEGDDFQKRVWELLRTIPNGETRSYGQSAREPGDPSLAQEVGAANGRNLLCVLAPCHRVVGADGSLVGFAGGLDPSGSCSTSRNRSA